MSDKLSPMQEQLLGQASNILKSVTETVSKATDFAAAQVPDIALQYVAYGRASSTLTVLLSIATLVFVFWVLINVCFRNKYKIDSDVRVFGGFLTLLFVGTPALVIFATNINQMIMVWLAPKVWLIRELVNLVK